MRRTDTPPLRAHLLTILTVILIAMLIGGFVVPGRSSSAHSVTHAASGTRLHLPLAPSEGPAAIGAGQRSQPFIYGASAASVGATGEKLRDMGFDYVKSHLTWATSEPSRGVYQWSTAPRANDASNLAADAERHGLNLVIRVDSAPEWAGLGRGVRTPRDPADFGRFMGALAEHLRGRVVAYEIWNEPNLSVEWGNRSPNPEEYAALLRAAYPRIKAADPAALVVAAGLATTGGDGGVTAMDDLQFLRRLYAAGAAPYFDVLGSHPYGFASAPSVRSPSGVLDFQRAADQRAVMVELGDVETPIWATEVGWLLDPAAEGYATYVHDESWRGREWQRVDAQTQARYLVEAYEYAYQHWPWMGGMFLFNFDFSVVPWYVPAEPMRWYAILDGAGMPRPAYGALKQMPKRDLPITAGTSS